MPYGFGPYGSSPYGALSSSSILYLADGVGAGDALWFTETVNLVDTIEALDAILMRRIDLVADGVEIDDAQEVHWIAVVNDALAAIDDAVSTGAFTQQVADGLSLQVLVTVVRRVFVADELDTFDAATVSRRQIIEVVDLLLASGLAISQHSALELVADALAAEDVAARGFREEVGDAASIADAMTQALHGYQLLTDSLDAEDAADPTSRFFAYVSDALVAQDASLSLAHLFEYVNDGVEIFGRLVIDDAVYTAWVINTENQAAWKYTNFDFNSFGQMPDMRYYGMRRDGLYWLEGDTDNGAAIKASLTVPKMDFGSNELKAIGAAYIAAKSDGSLVLKVTARNRRTGADETYWYRTEGRVLATHREDRFKVGKGLESLFFKFTLVNEAGADFEISQLKFLPIYLQRRV
jgi:hypothetical protein